MDYEELRQFLIDRCEEMFYAGGIGYALIDKTRIENADNDVSMSLLNRCPPSDMLQMMWTPDLQW